MGSISGVRAPSAGASRGSLLVKTRSLPGLVFDALNHAFIALFALVCILPFTLVLIASFSAEKSLNRIGIWFVPLEWSILPYEVILQSGNIMRAYQVSVGVTVTGTTLGVLFMSAMAYALSNKRTKYRNQLSFYIYLYTFTEMRERPLARRMVYDVPDRCG